MIHKKPKEAAMGHVINSPRSYRLLQQRLDRNVTGAPDSPVLRQILNLLFRPEEAELAAQIPTNFISLRRLARRTGWEQEALGECVTSMAERGWSSTLNTMASVMWRLHPW
jgi:hypothetical protein